MGHLKQTLQESRWVGRVLRDRWRIDQKIARGGMGTVFAATHKNNGSRAAIKVLHPEYARDADTKSRFIQEGYAANQVGHAGVVRILDDDTTEEGMPYIVMELLQGELLEQRRISSGGKLPFDEVIEVGEQLVDVMVAAHAKGIVHRDIKPDNIFVTNEGIIKVLDFGFARMRDGMRTEQTATGFLLGTPGFMAPEQAAGTRNAIDARTDVWAMGATLFVLLTGQPVHEGETAAEMLVAAANFQVRPVGELEPGLPMKLRQIVDRALAFDRNDRFPDARSMLMALRSLPRSRSMHSPADDDGRTLMRGPSPADLEPRTVMRSSSAQHEDPTVMGRVEELEPEALESIYTPMLKPAGIAIHPADDEQHTLALDPDGPTFAAPHGPATAKLAKFPSAEEPHDQNEHTVMMDSRPVLPNVAGIPSPLGFPTPFQPAPAPSPSYPQLPSPSRPSLPQAPISQPFLAPPISQQPVPAPSARSAGGSVLVFIAVAGITMVVVILTGLLVIVGTE